MYSRFFNCDLQVHTVADQHHNYGDRGTREPTVDFAQALIQEHANRGVQVIAVSDHNRVDWYPVLREAGDEADPRVWVFPGVEVSVNGCHLLIVWDRTDEGHELARHFVAASFPPPRGPFKDNGDPRVITEQGVLEVARAANKAGGLVLAPHSTMSHIGLFATGVCRNKAEVAQSGLVLGFDVIGDKGRDVLSNPASEFADRRPAWFVSGDTRAFESIGKRTSFLKLGATPTLEGLRQAFIMPQTRVRLPSHMKAEWSHVQHATFMPTELRKTTYIASVEVEGGFHDGLALEFGTGLNAIIGGKGTGKSALIEMLRYGLELDADDLPDRLVANREANLPANAEIHLTMETGEETTYRCSRAGGDQPASSLLQGMRDTGLRIRQRFQARVFGQQQLRNLVDHVILRSHVEDLAVDATDAVRTEEARLLSELDDSDARMKVLETQLSKQEEDEAEYLDLREQVTRATERGADELIAELAMIATKRQALVEGKKWLDATEELVELLARLVQLPEAVSAGPDDLLRVLQPVLDALASSEETLDAALTESQTSLDELTKNREPDLLSRAAGIRQSR